jgi:hypothetical protein
MKRLPHLLLAIAALIGGIWLLYAGYGRGVSLAGKTETGIGYVKTGWDGRARVPTHRWMYAGGLALIVGGAWWLLHGHKPGKTTRRRRR